MPKIPSRPALDLTGKWVVIDLPDRMDDYLGRTPDPHVLIRHSEFGRFTATFQFGTQQGEIDGRVDEVWPNAALLFFTFVGTEEGKAISGAGDDVGYNSQEEDMITGVMRYHGGDDLAFVWRRERPAAGATTGVKRATARGKKKA